MGHDIRVFDFSNLRKRAISVREARFRPEKRVVRVVHHFRRLGREKARFPVIGGVGRGESGQGDGEGPNGEYGFVGGWYKWFHFVRVGRENGFVW
jgi:hypothetical protein